MYWGDRDMESGNVLNAAGSGSGILEGAGWKDWVGACRVSCAGDQGESMILSGISASAVESENIYAADAATGWANIKITTNEALRRRPIVR